MHRTIKEDSIELKGKANNLLTLPYFPDFIAFTQKTVIQEATLHST